MNRHIRPRVSMEDTENNNVDENSNDHQYNLYANYHDQYTNQLSQRNLLNNDAYQERNERDQEQVGLAQLNGRLPNMHPFSYQNSNNSHRRNYSEGSSFNTENLPPLPRSNSPEGSRERLLSSNPNSLPQPRPRRNLPSREEIQNEGHEIFCNFAAEQFRKENIDPTQYWPYHPNLETSPSWVRAGQDLRALADEFSRSQERRELRNRAQDVNMHSLTMDNFFSMCSTLFDSGEGGITQERIVVLFTFISDIAIHHVRRRAERFLAQIMQWSLSFIYERICGLVREAGGWGVVLHRSANFLYQAAKFTCVVLMSTALAVYILKNFKHVTR